VRVAVARPLASPLTYSIPATLAGELAVGHVVLVPLGRLAETGYVVGLTDEIDFDPAKARPVTRLVEPEPAFDAEQLAFFEWAARYYLVPLGMVIQTALPSEIKAKVLRVIHATEAGVEAVTATTVEGHAAHVLREVISRPDLTQRGLTRRLGAELEKGDVKRALASLERHGFIAWGEKEIGGVQAKVRTIELIVSPAEALNAVAPSARRMRSLIDAVAHHNGPVDLPGLLRAQGSAARSSLNKLVERGLMAWGQRQLRDDLTDAPALGSSTAPTLNPDQLAALKAIAASSEDCFLLFGVTGSGKTEVFLGATETTLARGKQVLVLVPEIGLTPQLVGRFRARFGDQVAVLHSGLTGAERLAQWRRIRAGDAQVAVGARSALFAPFDRLGLVVVDEEHDDSYKQDEGVPYSARDLAVVLGRKKHCPVILASATPSLESWYNAKLGRYELLRLPNRATQRPVPLVELVDLTQLAVEDGAERPLLAPRVEQALRDTFANGGQAIVLYNRRGFATMVECTSCGGTYECPNCGITMTLHRRASTVACHYCGLKRSYTGDCPVCASRTLEELGKGTERIEATLKELFPDIPQARMDADTTAVRGAHARILDAFRRGETRLLVGTQIVAKGHDFPGVHTAVVISADQGLRMPDFRAAERTYSLLVQLAGRAGRGDVPGRVFVQTYNPAHYALRYLDDVEQFMARELRLRATMQYPPLTRLCLIRLEAVDRNKVANEGRRLAADLRGIARAYHGVSVLGPSLAALPRLVGRWRFQIIVRGKEVGPLRALLSASVERLHRASRGGVRVRWDVDPRHLL
jgi:primosomal protein N' (replication factor Y) (superfamily II helicase)